HLSCLAFVLRRASPARDASCILCIASSLSCGPHGHRKYCLGACPLYRYPLEKHTSSVADCSAVTSASCRFSLYTSDDHDRSSSGFLTHFSFFSGRNKKT